MHSSARGFDGDETPPGRGLAATAPEGTPTGGHQLRQDAFGAPAVVFRRDKKKRNQRDGNSSNYTRALRYTRGVVSADLCSPLADPLLAQLGFRPLGFIQ